MGTVTKMPPPVRETARDMETTQQAAPPACDKFTTKRCGQCAIGVEDLDILLNQARDLLFLFYEMLEESANKHKLDIIHALSGDPEAIHGAILFASDFQRVEPIFDASLDKLYELKKATEKVRALLTEKWMNDKEDGISLKKEAVA
jgi:hypothetical protein